MPTVGRNCTFGHSYIYRGEFYYVLLIKTEPLESEELP
jgi:hypothetical protein